MDYKIHHIGVATNDIEATAELYRKMGYEVTETVTDENQHVYVKFCELGGGVKVELVGLIDEKSPISKLLKISGTSTYHICYVVNNLDEAVAELRDQGYIPTTRRMPSTIGGRDVIFLYHTKNCLIELIEK